MTHGFGFAPLDEDGFSDAVRNRKMRSFILHHYRALESRNNM